MMRVIVDRWGTMLHNARSSDAEVAEALLGIKDAGHDVEIVSSVPEPQNGVGDKFVTLQTARLSGPAVLIDDDPNILALAARQGMIAVPAAHLVAFAAMVRR